MEEKLSPAGAAAVAAVLAVWLGPTSDDSAEVTSGSAAIMTSL